MFGKKCKGCHEQSVNVALIITIKKIVIQSVVTFIPSRHPLCNENLFVSLPMALPSAVCIFEPVGVVFMWNVQ